MKRTLITLIFAIIFCPSFSQLQHNSNTYLKLSGGRVAFGTGDYFGYSLAFEASTNVIKKTSPGLRQLLVGGEMIFENGVKNPALSRPGTTVSEDFFYAFYHTSNAVLWPKVSYYPLRKLVKGFNIQLGPTAGYSYRSGESSATISYDGIGNVIRTSSLFFDNGFTIGYRISTGIEFDFTPRIQTGFRLDWSNNNKGEINTLLAVKAGIRL
jgi:hypothetical protein